MRKIKYDQFISKSSMKCPPMTVKVLQNGKQIEQFETPAGFQLEKYVQSEFPNATITLRFRTKPPEAFIVRVFEKVSSKEILTPKKIRREGLDNPDFEFVGEYHEKSFEVASAKVEKKQDAERFLRIQAEQHFEEDDDTQGGNA